MSNRNAVSPFDSPSLRDLADSIGITQFPSETNWWQTMGGLLIQGGKILGATHGAPVVVPFNVGFITQCLGVWCQELGTNAHSWSVNNVTKNQFELILASGPAKDFYWWAIGV